MSDNVKIYLIYPDYLSTHTSLLEGAKAVFSTTFFTVSFKSNVVGASKEVNLYIYFY